MGDCSTYLAGRPRVNLTDLAETGFGYARDAAHRLAQGDNDGPAWVWHHCMDSEAREGFSAFLVQSQHPLAYAAGSPEWRFRTFATDFRTAVLKS